ncbi:phosphomannomutase [bacterium]|nr:MAG: phosphomannomutase [bacterium]
MVTGSHIPADRNGIKFNKPDGEVLKPDEAGIHAAVSVVRARLYSQDIQQSAFDGQGMLKQTPSLPEIVNAGRAYNERYTHIFADQPLAGKKVIFYQHSAVGRDLLVELLRELGADVEPVGRSDHFIPIDSENVKPEHRAYFKELAEQYPGSLAIVSTDGDSDRPFVVDETGEFHRGDILGAVVAHWLKADFAAYPISNSDAADIWLGQQGVPINHTKIGSPFVIAAMNEAEAAGKTKVVGWEANGGFLIGSDLDVRGRKMTALATRDAILPIIVALVAASEAGQTISELFAGLPQRYTQSGLIDDFPADVYRHMVERFGQDTPEAKVLLARFFGSDNGFGDITKINTLDGIRMYFENGDIAHLRQSSNAPQLRIYTVANTQDRANEMAAQALAEPDGIFRQIQKLIESGG